MRRRAPLLAAGFLLLPVLFASCAGEPRVALDSLELRDSVYLVPATGEPFTGEVFRPFEGDGDRLQLQGRLEEGAWNGELTVWHRDGSVRYQGRLVAGVQCGAWVENREEAGDESLHEALRRDIESLGLYPPCPEG